MENNKYYLIPAEKVDKRLAFLIDKGSSTRVAEIENILNYGYLVDLTEDESEDDSQKEYWQKEELREVLRHLNNGEDL